jgi:hypothetical protein
MGGRPIRTPFTRQRSWAALILDVIMARSNSAKTPSIWKSMRPDGVEVSMACWCRYVGAYVMRSMVVTITGHL